MIQLDNLEKNFIKKHKNLIEENRWEEFIHILYNLDEEIIIRILQFIYFDCEINLLEYINFIPYGLFSETNINSFTIPNNITLISNSAFMYSAIKSIIIPDSVKIIEDYAFLGCGNLKEADIHNVEAIGKGIFSECDNLYKLIISKNFSNKYTKSLLDRIEIRYDITTVEYK